MNGIFSTSVGKKILMSVTGLFLMVFLVVHLVMNLTLMFDSTGAMYNIGAHFMATNPLIRIMEPVLALSFLFHISYAVALTIRNRRARGENQYAKVNQSQSSTWTSRNMFPLGGLILVFLAIHLSNFYFTMKFGEMPEVTIEGVVMDDAYGLVSGLFIQFWWYNVIYILGALFLGLHLHHAFWSAFQSIGFSNDAWKNRLKGAGIIYTLVITTGFSIIPLYFMLIH